ncbi:MAG: LexA family transcriptional regulator [Bacteroidia bacterium]
MTHIGKNIKKIRSVKKLSQQAFADLFSLSRANIGSYEEGRAEPKIAVMMEIANKFGLDVEGLLNRELKVNEIAQFNGDKTMAFIAKKTTPDDEGMAIPFIKKNGYDSYVNNCESTEYLMLLQQVQIPGFSFKASRAFEVFENELLNRGEGVNEGDIIICIKKNAKEISELTEGKVYAVVLKDELIIRRLIFGLGTFELFADNRFFAPKEVYPEDIVELWEAHSIISSKGGQLKVHFPTFSRRNGSVNFDGD